MYMLKEGPGGGGQVFLSSISKPAIYPAFSRLSCRAAEGCAVSSDDALAELDLLDGRGRFLAGPKTLAGESKPGRLLGESRPRRVHPLHKTTHASLQMQIKDTLRH